MINKYRFLSLAAQIEEDPRRQDKLRRALRELEALLPSAQLEAITDADNNCPPESHPDPAVPDDQPTAVHGDA